MNFFTHLTDMNDSYTHYTLWQGAPSFGFTHCVKNDCLFIAVNVLHLMAPISHWWRGFPPCQPHCFVLDIMETYCISSLCLFFQAKVSHLSHSSLRTQSKCTDPLCILLCTFPSSLGHIFSLRPQINSLPNAEVKGSPEIQMQSCLMTVIFFCCC